MVEHLVANQIIGVRFSLPAQKFLFNSSNSAPARIRTWNDSSEDCCDIHFTTGAFIYRLRIQRNGRNANGRIE